MLVVALTGGIGSGKSTVSARLADLGAPVIDADTIAHELTAPGEPALAAIREAFGTDVLAPDGSLDRTVLRRYVFADPQARERLEAILHPRIRERMLARLAALDAPYAVLVIPLLFETGQTGLADRVLVVDLPEEEQIRRVHARSGLTEQEIRRILANQAQRRTRVAGADDLIDNSGDHAALIAQVDMLHRRYLELAAARAG
jgi:dephospho-CoA kinase